MPQDAFTLYHISNQLNSALNGAKVNKVVQPLSDEIVLYLYAKTGARKLALSANAENCRVCFTDENAPSPAAPPSFCMLLRKHLIGAAIAEVKLMDFERVIELKFSGRNELFDATEFVLMAEIMGKYSNIILTEKGKVLGAIKQASFDLDAKRPILPGARYVRPPLQNKVNPLEKDELTRVLGGLRPEQDGAEYLFSNVMGLSLPLCRELAERYLSGCSDVVSAAEGIFGFLTGEGGRANVAFQNGKPKDFYPEDYRMVGYDKKFYGSLIDAEEAFFAQKLTGKAFDQKLRKLDSAVSAERKKAEKKMAQVLEVIKGAEDSERNRLFGELLTAYQHGLKCGKSCEVVNYYSESGEKVKIPLDENLSINANAQRYFKKYGKQKRALEQALIRQNEAQAELSYLSSVTDELAVSAVIGDLDFVEQELIAEGIIKVARQPRDKKPTKSAPRKFEYDSYRIYIGRNNIQNDELTFSANRTDIWLHTKSYHSAHVIIAAENRKVSDSVIKVAAELCAYYGKTRGGGKADVDYCERRFVKKPKNAKPGGVIYTDFKTATVEPNPHTELEVK